jgi:hypothetical protein
MRFMKFMLMNSLLDDNATVTPPNPADPAPAAKDDKATPPAPKPDDKPGQTGDWKDSLPDELKNDPSIKSLKDVAALAKSYIHGQKLIGKDKIIVPDASYSDEQWGEVFKKLGMPESPDKYEIQAPKDADPEFLKAFKEFGVKNGILPRAGEKLMNFLHEHGSKVVQQQEEQAKASYEKAVTGLKQEWGQAYDRKLAEAKEVFKKFADENTQKFLREEGLTNNPDFIKFMAKIAASFGEGKFINPGGTGEMGITPTEAEQKITAIYSQYPNHPYFNKNNPGHEAARAEMAKLIAAKQARKVS